MADYFIPEGTTEEQTFRLMADGAAIDGTGLTLDAEVTDRSGRAVTLSGIAWKTALSGIARWLPAAGGELKASGSPYQVRWKLTDSSGRVAKVPNGEHADRWVVVRP